MKVILSRKGFDSTSGGYPSPIINNQFISLPIPDEDGNFSYNDIYVEKDKTYFDIMKDLKESLVYNGNRIILKKETKFLLYPDLFFDTLKNRVSEWRPLFGQIGSSQTHLENQGVKEGDLFLFFGWFRRAVKRNGKYRFIGPDFHSIYSAFQIDKIIKIINDEVEDWMKYHPHLQNKYWTEDKTNTLYLGRKKITINSSCYCVGKLSFDQRLALTKTGHSRSHWDLPDFFKEIKISHHPDPWRVDKETGDSYFQSAGRGQEFVVVDNIRVNNWFFDKFL